MHNKSGAVGTTGTTTPSASISVDVGPSVRTCKLNMSNCNRELDSRLLVGFNLERERYVEELLRTLLPT